MSETTLLTVTEIAEKSGLSIRQIQRLAKAGKIPGAVRGEDGYHREYPDSKELRDWIKYKRTGVRKGKLPDQDKIPSFPDRSLRKWTEEIDKFDPIEEWSTIDLLRLSKKLRYAFGMYAAVEHILREDRLWIYANCSEFHFYESDFPVFSEDLIEMKGFLLDFMNSRLKAGDPEVGPNPDELNALFLSLRQKRKREEEAAKDEI